MAIRTYCMLIDIKRDIFEIIKIKPVDTGNKLHIKFSEDGKPVDLTGQTVKFMAIKPDNKGVYNFAKVINAKTGEVEVEITNQMTAVEGELECEIEIEGEELITTLTFYITIDHKLNNGEFIESTNEFTVLQKAIRDAYKAIDQMEQKTDAKLEHLQTEVTEAIDNMNRVTDSKLSQVQSQVDTAVRDMNSKADTKMSQLQSQVNTAIDDMNNTTDAKLLELQSQVNVAIEGMNNTTSTKLVDLQRQVTTAISDMNSKAESKLSQIQSQTDDKLLDIQGQFGTLETGLTKKVNDKIVEVTSTQSTLTQKVDAKIAEVSNTQSSLIAKVDAKILELTNVVNNKIGEVNSKLGIMDTKIAETDKAVSNANNTVNKLKQDVSTAIAGIDTKIDSKLATKADINHNHDTLYLGKTAKAESAKVADSANAVAWENVSGKPVSFTPASHNHDSNYLKLSGGTVSGTINATNIQVGGANVYTTSRKPTPADIGASASNHTHTTLLATSLSGQNVSLDTFNLVSGTPQVAHYYCPTDGGGTGITGRPNDSTKNAFSLKVELIRWASTTDYITKQTYIRGIEKVIYVRYCTNGTWSAWEKVYTSSNKPTPADIGASASNHTHNYAGSSSAGGPATSALSCTGNSATATTLQTARTINGTSFNGSGNITTTNWGTARTITIGNTAKSVNGSGNVSWSLSEIGADAGATANKLVLRDSAGDVNVRLVRSNYPNQSTLSGALAFRVNNSSDNYVRFCSDTTAIRNWLGASASNHTHSYVPLSGGTITGDLTVNGRYILGADTNKNAGIGYEVSTTDTYIANSVNNWLRLKTNKTMTYAGYKVYTSFEKPTASELGFGNIPATAQLISNLNSAVNSGWYSINPDTAGRPSGVTYGIVLQMRWHDAKDFYQILISSNNARIYTRGYINGGYTSWNEK